jgi:hypothetical protein
MSEPVLVYLLAASHSGSTLTAMLLNAHEQICTAGELKATNVGDTQGYRCSCKELIDDCEFWQGISREMQIRSHDYTVRNAQTSLRDIPGNYVQRLLRPLHRGAVMEGLRDLSLAMSSKWRQGIRSWSTRNRDLVHSIAELSGATYIADSSKIAVRLKYLLRIRGLRVKVVRLIRDGRGVALTYMNPSAFADARDPQLRGGGSGVEHHERLSMEAAAREWRRSNEEAEMVLRTIPREDWIEIKYESLCTDTAATMNAIHEFLGIESSAAYASFRDRKHHVVGNGMRLDDSSEITLDERWREALDANDLAVFDQVAGQLNKSYGYP